VKANCKLQEQTMSIYEMLRAKWIAAGVAVNDPITPAALDRFEKKHRIPLLCEFKDYLFTVNGMQDGQVDEDLVSFLSLEAIDQGANCKEISTTELLTAAQIRSDFYSFNPAWAKKDWSK
jgi:hypothetical protein